MMRGLGFLGLGLVFALVSSPSVADTNRPVVDISGAWNISTTITSSSGCKFTGIAQLNTTAEPKRYDCTLTTTHICDGRYHFVVEQTCTAKNFGSQVSIRSTITRYLKRDTEPGWEEYRADNFALTIKSNDELFGNLNGRHIARWKRSESGIS